MPSSNFAKRSPRKRESIPQGVRFDVFRRDNFTCVYCGRGSPDVELHCDHKIAHSKGGSNDRSNLVTACRDCNSGKSAKTVKTTSGRNVNNGNGFVGLYGHTRDDDGVIDWQFEVIGKISEEFYTIQLFSWLDGSPTEVKVASICDLSKSSLYSSRAQWIGQWARESSRVNGRRKMWAKDAFYLEMGRNIGGAA